MTLFILRQGTPVSQLIAERFPATLELALVAAGLALLIGIPMGVYAALRRGTFMSQVFMTLSLLGVSLPTFLIGILLILVFAVILGWFPSFGRGEVVQLGGWSTGLLTVSGWQAIILPAITLALPYTAYIARLLRTSMLETLGQDFIRTARAKGLRERVILYKHALRVAILPVISFLGPLAAHLLTGSIVVETLFHIPGAGGFFVNSILNRDGFLLGGVVIVYCAMLVIFNTLVDILYSALDRRIRLDG